MALWDRNIPFSPFSLVCRICNQPLSSAWQVPYNAQQGHVLGSRIHKVPNRRSLPPLQVPYNPKPRLPPPKPNEDIVLGEPPNRETAMWDPQRRPGKHIVPAALRKLVEEGQWGELGRRLREFNTAELAGHVKKVCGRCCCVAWASLLNWGRLLWQPRRVVESTVEERNGRVAVGH